MNEDQINVNIYFTHASFVHSFHMCFREIRDSAVPKQPLATGQQRPELNNPEWVFQTFIIIFQHRKEVPFRIYFYCLVPKLFN